MNDDHAPMRKPRPSGRGQAGQILNAAPQVPPYRSGETPADTAGVLHKAGGLGVAGLEAVYDELAQAIDQAGPEKAELFLVKLALLNAEALSDAGLFSTQLQTALRDL